MKIKIRHFFLPVLGLLLLVLAGCSESSEAGKKPVRAMELLSPMEVEALIGAPVQQPPKETFQEKKEMDFWMTMVTYWAEQPGISLTLMVQPFAAGEDKAEVASAAYLKSLRTSLPDYSPEAVDGIGTLAWWDGPTGQLTVFHEQRMYLVTVNVGGGDISKKFDLAKKAASLALVK